MEINANPSFNMFLERDLANGEVEKTLSELDKYLKSKVASESIRIVTNVSCSQIIISRAYMWVKQSKKLLKKTYSPKYYQMTQ